MTTSVAAAHTSSSNVRGGSKTTSAQNSHNMNSLPYQMQSSASKDVVGSWLGFGVLGLACVWFWGGEGL